MINKPKGYDDAKAYTEAERLPIGGYVLKIMNAKTQNYTWGQVLVVAFDIIEGDYKDFFKNNFDMQQQEDKKWKGTIRINLPKDDGTEQDNWTLRSLKTNMTAIEDSNEGYTWDWNEDSLKGKIVGGIFRNKQYEYEGKTGFFTECFKLMAVDKIREGKFKMPEDKLLNKSADTTIPEGFGEFKDEDIPF